MFQLLLHYVCHDIPFSHSDTLSRQVLSIKWFGFWGSFQVVFFLLLKNIRQYWWQVNVCSNGEGGGDKEIVSYILLFSYIIFLCFTIKFLHVIEQHVATSVSTANILWQTSQISKASPNPRGATSHIDTARMVQPCRQDSDQPQGIWGKYPAWFVVFKVLAKTCHFALTTAVQSLL